MNADLTTLAKDGNYKRIAEVLERYPDGADKRLLIETLFGLVFSNGALKASTVLGRNLGVAA